MYAEPVIKKNTVILSLEEYENLKKEMDSKDKKIKDLNNVIKDKGKVLLTRYDINPTPEAQKVFVDYILETYERLFGNPANRLYEIDCYGSLLHNPLEGPINERKHQEDCMRQSIEAFVKKFLNTTSRPDYSKTTSKVINFKDIEEEIKAIYNHKYFEEFGERILKLENDEKEYAKKIQELDKNTRIQNFQSIIETLKEKLKKEKKEHEYDVEKYENIKESLNNDKLKLQSRLNTLERELKDKDSQLELYRTTIEDQKALHQYNESKGLFNFFK